MTFHRRLLERTRNIGNSLCVGLDPVMRKLPRTEGAAADRVRHFYADLLEAMIKRRLYPAAVKPNIAYFEALGVEALEALRRMIAEYLEREAKGQLRLRAPRRVDDGCSG